MRARAFGLALLTLAAAGPARAADPVVSTLMAGRERNIRTSLYTPPGPGPFASVMVLGTSAGVSEADEAFCLRLAEKGYRCAVPRYLEAYGISERERAKSFKERAPELMGDFRAIITRLGAMPGGQPGKVAAIGFSNGGFFALLLASSNLVAGGVSYYGAITGAGATPNLGPFRQRFKETSAPVLVLAGDRDMTIKMEPVRMLETILKEARAPHELVIYPGATHNFDRRFDQFSNVPAANDAWARTLAFLARVMP